MSTSTFDTLTAARTLEGAGMDSAQAEAVVETVRVAVVEGAVTKTDVADLRADIAEVRTEIADLRAETKADIAEMRTEIADLRAETKAEAAGLRADLGTVRSDVRADIADTRTGLYRALYTVGTALLAAQVAAVFALLRLLGGGG